MKTRKCIKQVFLCLLALIIQSFPNSYGMAGRGIELRWEQRIGRRYGQHQRQ